MASRDDLIEALSDCIDRLAAGEPLDAILRDYPQHANQLAPMLEAGRLFPRARFPLPEVQAAQVAVEPLVRQTVREVFRGGLSRLWWLLALVVVMAGIGTPVIVSGLSGVPPTSTATVTATATSTPTSTATATATPTLTATVTTTPTASPTLTPTSTLTATSTTSPTRAAITAAPVVIPPSATASLTATVPPTLMPTPTIERFIVIEGPVTAISGTQVNIYGLDIVFASGSPALTVVQVGDIIRVEGVADVSGDAIVVINVTFVNVTVVIVDGLAWRGDSCAVPPPSWAQASAGDWFRRCTGGGSTGGGGDDDDNDDDDD